MLKPNITQVFLLLLHNEPERIDIETNKLNMTLMSHMTHHDSMRLIMSRLTVTYTTLCDSPLPTVCDGLLKDITASPFQRWEGILRILCIVAWSVLLSAGVFINALGGDFLFPPADLSPLEGSNCRYVCFYKRCVQRIYATRMGKGIELEFFRFIAS